MLVAAAHVAAMAQARAAAAWRGRSAPAAAGALRLARELAGQPLLHGADPSGGRVPAAGVALVASPLVCHLGIGPLLHLEGLVPRGLRPLLVRPAKRIADADGAASPSSAGVDFHVTRNASADGDSITWDLTFLSDGFAEEERERDSNPRPLLLLSPWPRCCKPPAS